MTVNEPKILTAGIDSLYVGFNIDKWLIEDNTFKRLDYYKEKAGDKLFGSKGKTVEFAGKEFNLLPKGSKGYKYVLNNDDIRLLISENCQGGRVLPEVFVALNSSFLWGLGYEYAFKKLIHWIMEWALISGNRINRADICVDLNAPLPIIDLRNELVTRAKSKVDYHEVDHYSNGIRDTGYMIGKDIIICRIYDKRYEAIKSRKSWFIDLWNTCGYDGQSPVTRVEGQFRRQYLKEMSVDNFSDLLVRMPDIWRVFSNEFVTIRKQNPNDSNRRRWQVSPLWQTVQNASNKFGNCLGIQRYEQKQVKIDPLKAQMKGLIATIVAIDSNIRGEYHAKLILKSELDQYLESVEFQNKVIERKGRYASI
jgi:hypothetical protein